MNKRLRNFLLIAFLIQYLSVLGQGGNAQLITSGPGPEDLVIDTLTCYPRLLISTCSRRAGSSHYGEIEEYRIDQGSSKVLIRKGEPAGIEFRPHGIYLADLADGVFLYVISHERKSAKELILRYRVFSDHLLFDRQFQNYQICSPNALTVFPDGSFLVCNDAAKPGNKLEQMLGQKKATIIYCDGQNTYTQAAQKLGMPAGINHYENQVFVSCATENKMYQFQFDKGLLTNKKVFCEVKGPDNIRFFGETLLVACHLKTLKFIRHISHPNSPSPSTVYRIPLASAEKAVLFADTGSTISAASVAVVYQGKLFIGQIFERGIGVLEVTGI